MMSERLEEIAATNDFVLIAIASDELDTFHIIWGNVTLNLTLAEVVQLHDLMNSSTQAILQKRGDK